MAEKIEFDCWSHNGEEFDRDFESARDFLGVGSTIYEGIALIPDASDFVDVDWTLERMSEIAYENHKEYASGYLDDVSDEAKKELEQAIIAWLNKHAEPTFYKVINITERLITEDDY